jgi:hypothetical protein
LNRTRQYGQPGQLVCVNHVWPREYAARLVARLHDCFTVLFQHGLHTCQYAGIRRRAWIRRLVVLADARLFDLPANMRRAKRHEPDQSTNQSAE